MPPSYPPSRAQRGEGTVALSATVGLMWGACSRWQTAMSVRRGARHARDRALSSQTRRRRLRRTFDAIVLQEWNRYSGQDWRVLVRTLRERFLQIHLGGVSGFALELGPGPGRFTPIVRRRPRARVVSIDLSRESLVAARERGARARGLAAIDWVRGVGEFLPLRTGSVDSAVVLGNIVSFAAADGPVVLRELARAVRPGGVLVADFRSSPGAIQQALHRAADRRLLSRFLRHSRYYLVNRILDSGHQPYAPDRLSPWEVEFYTVPEATRALNRAGFRVIDAMAVAPATAFQDRVLAIARRDTKSWNGLLRIEERIGRRPGAQDLGHGFMVAAIRK